MDADERLTALKKAYADIILNTAKEAAGRIMVSERKVVRTQHELNVMKDQALQMLLRLKQMMDSKVCEAGMTYLSQQKKIEELESQLQKAEDTISEAETVSLSQQRKIEELEAQLQEAEDIVKDLREELREVQAEMEMVRNNKSQDIVNHDTVSQKQVLDGNIFETSLPIRFPARPVRFPPPNPLFESFTSDVKTSAFNQRNDVHRYFNVNSPISEEHRQNTSQSVMFPTPKSQIGSFTDSEMKTSALSKRNEVCNGYNPNDVRIGTSHVSKPALPSMILGGKEPQPFRNRRTQRIRAFEEKLMAGELTFSEPVDEVNYETSGREDGEDEESLLKMPAQKVNKARGRKKKALAPADNSSNQVQKVRKVRGRRRRVSTYMKAKALSSRNQLNLTTDQTSDIPCLKANSFNSNAQAGGVKGITLGCTEVAENEVEFHEAPRVGNTVNKDKASTDKLLPVRQESENADNSRVPVCMMDLEKAEEPAGSTGAQSSLAGRVIKYTFQRKRKREALSSSAGNGDVENGLPETAKASSTTEPSRDSRRVAQVARQLISLSEKKWWQ